VAKSRRSPKKAPETAVFPVVGIGASAGGLEAFKALLKALPPDTGMAFVLVQHMDPKHESLLYQLLSKATAMPVAQVADRTSLEPNRVYVIPPNKDLTVDRGVLRLANLRSGHMPIDNFFSSLAKDQQEKAIGVILSGTASDGTRGLKAIKGFGGITFAQDQKSAKYSGMPMSAVASGYVDFVLPPQQIARQLRRLAEHPGVAASESVSELPEESEALKTVFRLLRTTTDVDFSLYKLKTIKRRIQRRMILREIPDLDRYVRYLQTHPSEIHDLFEDILIPVTQFFREPETFRALENDVFPKIAANARKAKSIRIWVAGCSTGEEVYSIAIALLEYLHDQAAPLKIQIFGTDLSERVIQVARIGLYTDSVVKNVSRDRLRRFFVKTEGGYQIAKSIREICIFARHDLAKDPPFAKLDLISCQNVFIYLGTALQKRIMAGFHYALNPSGFLVLGKSEAPSAYTDFFTLEDRKNKIFSRKPTAVRPLPAMPALPLEKPHSAAPVSAGASTSTNLVEEARRILLENYSAPAFIVDSGLNILHFQGDTSPFIKPSTGAASFHLVKMLRPEFAVDLRSLVHRARKDGTPVRREAIEFEHGGQPKRVAMEVVPVHAANSTASNFMVLFPKMEPVAQESPEEHLGHGKGRGDSREVEALRRELAATRKSLKSITEDQEAANEELKAANEEILSSNEELASTNEELETAKEELQSANEELTTLNDELQNRNVELSTFADDLSNLLIGVNIPILILDGSRRIQRFTPAAQRVFNLIPTDIGRPFGEVSSNFETPNWNELISRVTDHSQTVETDVAGRNGRWYSLRMRPYKISENKIDGVLIALLDVDQLKRQLGQSEDSLKTSEELYRLVTENTRDLVALHSADSKYIYVSPSRERLLGYSQQETIGKPPTEFCHPDDRKNVALAFKKAARSGTPSQATYRVITRDGRELWLEALISPIADDKKRVTRLLTATRDITERKRGDDKLRESEFTVRTLLDSASQGIIVVDPRGKIVLANRAAEGMFGYRKQELLENRIDNLIPRPLRARHNKEHGHFFLEPETRQMGVGLNLSGRRKNGKEFPVEVRLSHMQANQATLAVAFVTDVSEHKHAEAALLESHDKLLVLSGRLMSVQDEESKRIARELHDTFSQELAALCTESRLLKRELPPEARGAAKKIEGVALRIGRLATDIHQMSRRLHPAILDDLGLPAALRAECNAFSQLHGIHTDFGSSKVPKSVPGNVALCLYRVAHESLQNIAKHSGAQKARVDLTFKRREIHLTIEDFGHGFDLQDQKRKKRGLGLISMEERLRFVGGTLTIDSKPGRGTKVQARIPLKNKQ
jgi:two-component system CheB/CheR fusion protein